MTRISQARGRELPGGRYWLLILPLLFIISVTNTAAQDSEAVPQTGEAIASASESMDAPVEEPPAAIGSASATAHASLPMDEIVARIAEQNGVEASQLVVHPFATFTVIEHPESGRNWVIARPAASGGQLQVAASTLSGMDAGGGSVPQFETSGAAPSGGEIAVVEVSAEGVASEPTLLAGHEGAMGAPISIPGGMIDSGPPPDSGPAIIPSGFLQFGTTYHSNVFLTDE